MKGMVCGVAVCALMTVAQAGTEFGPDLLRLNSGKAVTSAAEWEDVRRAEVAEAILPVEYGHMPAAPSEMRVVQVGAWKKPEDFPGVNTRRLKVWCKMDEEDVAFVIEIWCRIGDPGKKYPLLLEGDGCWDCLTRKVILSAIDRGWMVAQFNRCEVAPDYCEVAPADRRQADSTLLKWAWTYHRAIDALLKAEPRVDASRIAITGHSRGGKTVLLAGATDTRIFAVGENGSGCGGAAPLRDSHPEAETIAIITKAFPYWFESNWGKWMGHEHELGFDQHFLLSLIPPRKLFIRQGTEDAWVDPRGIKRVTEAASKVWELYGKPENVTYSTRPGVHGHLYEDYMAFLEFAEGNGPAAVTTSPDGKNVFAKGRSE